MASKYLKRFQVPNNFENILSDFAKEILRNQPKDIIDFGIEYFKGLENHVKLDYKDKGENLPENYKRPENQEPNIINAPNNLEISQEDKGRLQRSMEKIEKINKEPEHIEEKEEEKIKEEKEEKEEKIERHIEEREQRNEEHIEHVEQNVQVTKEVTVITKETLIRNGEVIKDEEKVERQVYDDNNKQPELDRFKEIEKEKEQQQEQQQEQKEEQKEEQQEPEQKEEEQQEKQQEQKEEQEPPQVFKKVEENEQREDRYKESEEPKAEIEEPKVEVEQPKVEESEIKKEEKEEPRFPEETEKKEEKNEKVGYDDWFVRHSHDNMVIKNKPEDNKMEVNTERYEGDYQSWFENHSKTSNKI